MLAAQPPSLRLIHIDVLVWFAILEFVYRFDPGKCLRCGYAAQVLVVELEPGKPCSRIRSGVDRRRRHAFTRNCGELFARNEMHDERGTLFRIPRTDAV